MPTPTGHGKIVCACHRGRGAVLQPGGGGVWAPKAVKVPKSGEMADFGVYFRCVGPRWGVCARFDPRNIVRVPYEGKLGG